jgi:hypothetical protein
MKKFLLASGASLLLALAGCSDAPKPAENRTADSAPSGNLEPVTGQSALFKMYQLARAWAPDSQVLKLNSTHLTDVPESKDGKAGGWEAVFTSVEKGKARSFTYSLIDEGETLHKGAFAGQEMSWSGSTGVTQPFLIAAVKIDTDKAYNVAKQRAADYARTNPNMPITYLLEKDSKHTDPVWRVIWGTSAASSAMSVFVNATTGDPLETMH